MSVIKTQSRERAVLLLFEADNRGLEVKAVLDNLDVVPEKYTVEILESYVDSSERVEELIGQYAKGWSKDRLPAMDRAVLRMAITELVRSADIPVGTIISEAVELCERYSTPESPKYVNGVLGTVAHQVRGVDLIKTKKTQPSE